MEIFIYFIIGAVVAYIALQLDKDDKLSLSDLFWIGCLWPAFIILAAIAGLAFFLIKIHDSSENLGNKIMNQLRKFKL